MFKKLLVITLVLAIFLSPQVLFSQEKITPAWIKEAVEFFTETGDFVEPLKPYDWVTHQEFLKISLKLYPVEVKEETWLLEAQGRKLDLILREPFRPEDFITREEAITIIIRIANRRLLAKIMSLKEADTILSPYKDYDQINPLFIKSIAVAVKEKIITGYPDKSLKPRSVLTQAEIWALLYKIRGPITFLHLNDSHGRLEPFVPGTGLPAIGGFGRIATLISTEKAKNPTLTLVADLGDTIHGTNLVNLFKGKPAIEAMNLIGVNVATLGNHDFNYGQSTLKDRFLETTFPYILSNVVYENREEYFAVPYRIVDVMGQKVGFFGLIATELPYVTHPDNVKGLKILDPVETAKKMVKVLREQKAQIIVALTHIGFSEDVKLAESVEGIHLIIGGHSHTVVEEPKKIGNTFIVQAGEHTRNLGRVSVAVRKGEIIYEKDSPTPKVKENLFVKGALIPTSNDVLVDPQVTSLIKPYSDAVKTQMDRVIGAANVLLDGTRAFVRTRETNLGNLVADVMRIESGAEIALQNGGGIRASIPAGLIKVDHVFTVLPFDNYLVVIELTGAQIREALELSVSRYPAELGGFLQVSGISFVFDPKKPVNSRVEEIFVGDKPIVSTRTYKVATNDFLAVGGDGYTVFAKGKLLIHTGDYLRDAFIRYVERVKTLNPTIEGRIKVKP